MASTASIAGRKKEAKKNIEELLRNIGCEIPLLGNSYRSLPLAEVLYLEQIEGALSTLIIFLPETETHEDEDPPIENSGEADGSEHELLEEPNQELDPGEQGIPPGDYNNPVNELEDMNSEDLRKYADALGVKYPKNITDPTLITKIGHFNRLTKKE